MTHCGLTYIAYLGGRPRPRLPVSMEMAEGLEGRPLLLMCQAEQRLSSHPSFSCRIRHRGSRLVHVDVRLH
jgi:hypothetical protein